MSDSSDSVAATDDVVVLPKTVSFLIALKNTELEDGKVGLFGTEMHFPNVADYVVGDTVYLRNDFDKENPLVVESIGEIRTRAVTERKNCKTIYDVHFGEVSKEPISRAEADAAQAKLEEKYAQ